MLNRRQFLTAASAATIAAAMPLPALALAEPALPAVAKFTPMWAVGTPGEYDWQAIAADTLEEAIQIFAEENDYLEEDGSLMGEIDGQRCKIWDELPGKPSDADWLRAGLGAFCSRCKYETSFEEGAYALGDEAVCDECMTLADFEVADPSRAALMREYMAA